MPAGEEVDTDEVALSSVVRGIDRRILTLIDITANALKRDKVVGL